MWWKYNVTQVLTFSLRWSQPVFNAAVGYPEVASTSTLSQRRQMTTKPSNTTSMTSRKLSLLATGMSPCFLHMTGSARRKETWQCQKKANIKLLLTITHTQTLASVFCKMTPSWVDRSFSMPSLKWDTHKQCISLYPMMSSAPIIKMLNKAFYTYCECWIFAKVTGYMMVALHCLSNCSYVSQRPVVCVKLGDVCCLRPLRLSHRHLSRFQPVLVRYPQLHRNWYLHWEELCVLLGLRCKSTTAEI